MAEENNPKLAGSNPILSEFGAFYPTGHLIVAFERKEDAQKVRQDLMTGGYEESECEIAPCDFMIEATQRSLNSSGFLARIGASVKFMEKHLEVAKRGATFLLIYAPNLLECERAMRVIRRVPSLILAHRYTRLVIQELE
jgi:hypothetical protein